MNKRNFNSKNNAPEYLLKVFRLVTVMSKSEKNMLRRTIRNYSDENNQEALYILLFDCINDVWKDTEKSIALSGLPEDQTPTSKHGNDESGLTKEAVFLQKFSSRFRLRSFMPETEINGKAKYLYDKILESLRKETSNQTLRGALLVGMLDAHLLYNKNLMDDCLNQIEKLKVLATQIEAAPVMLELLRMERRVRTNSGKMHSMRQLRNIYEAESQWLTLLNYNVGLHDLNIEVLYAEIELRQIDYDDVLREKINAHLEHLSGHVKPPFESVEYNFNKLGAQAHLYKLTEGSAFLEGIFVNHDNLLIYQCFQQIVDYFESNPILKSEYPARYNRSVSNAVSYAILARQPVDPKYMPILEQIPPTDPDFLNLTVYLNLINFLSKKDFYSAEAFLEKHKILVHLNSYGHIINLSRKQTIAYSAGVIYFLRGKYDEAGRYFSINQHIDRSGISHTTILEASTLYLILCLIEDGTAKRHKHRKTLLHPFIKRFEVRFQHGSAHGFIHQLFDILPKVLELSPTGTKMSILAQDTIDSLKAAFFAERAQVSHLGLCVGWLESKAKKVDIVEVIGEYI